MEGKTIEIRHKTGVDNYDTILFPKTKLSCVYNNLGVNLEEEIMNIKSILNHSKISSLSMYVCNEDNQVVIPINNENYNYLDSQLEVYYNGLLLVKGLHYILEGTNNIKVLGFSLNINDEIVFKVLNSLKVNVDIEYENIDESNRRTLKDVINSINNYINLVNDGKKKISDEFKSGNIQVEWNDSFEKMASELKKLIDARKGIPNDLGNLFTKPYFGANIDINFGVLFGISTEMPGLTSNFGGLF